MIAPAARSRCPGTLVRRWRGRYAAVQGMVPHVRAVCWMGEGTQGAVSGGELCVAAADHVRITGQCVLVRLPHAQGYVPPHGLTPLVCWLIVDIHNLIRLCLIFLSFDEQHCCSRCTNCCVTASPPRSPMLVHWWRMPCEPSAANCASISRGVWQLQR